MATLANKIDEMHKLQELIEEMWGNLKAFESPEWLVLERDWTFKHYMYNSINQSLNFKRTNPKRDEMSALKFSIEHKKMSDTKI